MTPLEQYHLDLAQRGFIKDPAQERAITALNAIFNEVTANQSWLAKILLTLKLRRPPKGLYLWGHVGAGKTYLMDTFYRCLPEPIKMREHFHEFMGEVHHRLKQLQGQHNPLAIVAAEFAKGAKIICFDEFFVNDIGDAMILGNLLKQLFAQGVTLVTTSNAKPDNLYKDDAGNEGLQRARFLPTIALLKAHCQIIEVNNAVDYRLQDRLAASSAARYFTPLNAVAAQHMQERFHAYALGETVTHHDLIINDRKLAIVGKTDTVLWLDFAELCVKPRHAEDYLLLAQMFQTIMISGIPVIYADQEKPAKRFIHAIDVFYDQGKELIISAAAPIDELYQGQLYRQSFKRTASRLHEMMG